jgi:hypothetical protein
MHTSGSENMKRELIKKIQEDVKKKLEDQQPLQYKYNEDTNMSRIQEYINSTYGQHYVGNDQIQTLDVWESLGISQELCQGTAIKYLMRWGKKEGHNQKDLLKAIHYIILLMHFANRETP